MANWKLPQSVENLVRDGIQGPHQIFVATYGVERVGEMIWEAYIYSSDYSLTVEIPPTILSQEDNSTAIVNRGMSQNLSFKLAEDDSYRVQIYGISTGLELIDDTGVKIIPAIGNIAIPSRGFMKDISIEDCLQDFFQMHWIKASSVLGYANKHQVTAYRSAKGDELLVGPTKEITDSLHLQPQYEFSTQNISSLHIDGYNGIVRITYNDMPKFVLNIAFSKHAFDNYAKGLNTSTVNFSL